MNHNPDLHAQKVLSGTAKVGGDSTRSSGGDDEKECAFSLVEVLDEVVDSPRCSPALRKKCLVSLPAACVANGTLPSRYLSVGRLTVDHQSTFCVCGADIRRGTLDGLAVTVKLVPYNSAESLCRSQEDAYREIVTWGNLTHPNILPFLGVDKCTLPLSIISASAQYGSLREYLARFPYAKRLKLLLDTSRGLEYMHDLDCIHGDLKGSSVLVNASHSAVLANSQLGSFLPESEVDTGTPISECDAWSVRWLAPELLFPEEFGLESACLTKETDVYALAMVMYEVFSGSFPFQGIRNEASILRIRSGDHPRRPKGGSDLGLTNELWKMMKTCWKRRDRRWKIARIVLTLERCSPAAAAE